MAITGISVAAQVRPVSDPREVAKADQRYAPPVVRDSPAASNWSRLEQTGGMLLADCVDDGAPNM
jgi:hypothetical protein